jgi:hypothetical protein
VIACFRHNTDEVCALLVYLRIAKILQVQLSCSMSQSITGFNTEIYGLAEGSITEQSVPESLQCVTGPVMLGMETPVAM